MATNYSIHNDLELTFNKVFNPIRKDIDPNLVTQFCNKLNNDIDGVNVAIRLIINKMQSEQEWESIIALYVLEACVKNCGERFHSEINKFRFLNEMIKLVSPKYLANKTSEKVKNRCIEIMYSWTLSLPNETKIKEAYEMLKKQGIVQNDPKCVDKLIINVPPRQKNPIFDDQEKSKKLAKLLQSKDPKDLEEANRLIKTMVRQDEIKTEKVSLRINELEQMNNNCKLLNDMLLNYNKSTVSESEKDTMKLVYEELERSQPNLEKLASESDENDDGIGDIIKTSENVTRVLTQYKAIVDNDNLLRKNDDVKMINTIMNDDSNDVSKTILMTTNNENVLICEKKYDALRDLQDLFLNTTTNNDDRLTSQSSSLSNIYNNPTQQHILSKSNNNSGNSNNEFGLFVDDSLNNNNTGISLKPPLMPTTTLASSNNTQQLINSTLPIISTSDSSKLNQNNSAKTPQMKAIDDLNELGRTLLEQSLINNNDFTKSQQLSQQTMAKNAKKTLIEIQQEKQIKTNQIDTTNQQTLIEQINDNSHLFNSLNNLFIPLETIKPGSQPPMTIYEKNDIKVILHFGRDSPMLHCYVIVVSITSTNSLPVKNVNFQAAVPKNMKVKLQPATSNELNAYNPILPMSAITQIMLIASPVQDKIRLKFKFNYSINNQNFNELGDINDLPVIKDLL